MHNESAWTLLADTKPRVSADGRGVIIPESDFLPLKLKPREKRSFYIVMNGPWIDVRADALDKTGEVQQQTDDMAIFVGVGLTSRFPEEFDRTVAPQFSGSFHYRKAADCNDVGAETKVNLQFLVSQAPNPVFLGIVKAALDDLIEEKLLLAPPFNDFVSTFSLQKGEETEIATIFSDIECPDDWDQCPSVALNPTLSFKHARQMRSGQLRYQLSRFGEAIAEAIGAKLQLSEILYVGMRPMETTFQLSFPGLPHTQNPEDIEYLETVTTIFLDDTVQERTDLVEVLDVVAFDQTSQRRLRGLSSDFSMSGTIFGVQGGFLPQENFVIQMKEAFKTETDQYMSMLSSGLVRSRQGATLSSPAFENITTVGADVFAKQVTPGTWEETSIFSSSAFSATTLIYVAGALLFAFFCWLIYNRKQRAKYKEEVTEYRDTMKADRLNKREEIRQSIESQSEGALTAESLHNQYEDELEAAFELGYDAYKKKVEVCGLDPLSAHDLVDGGTTLRKSDGTGSVKLERTSVHGDSSSHSSLSLHLTIEDVLSDVDDDLSDSDSDSSFAGDSCDASVASGAESVVSRASHASSASGRSLLSAFMEKQSEKQAQKGLHISGGSSVVSNLSGSLHAPRGVSRSRSDDLKSYSEHGTRHVTPSSHSYMASQYAVSKRGVRRAVSDDGLIALAREVQTINENLPSQPESPGPTRRAPSRSKSHTMTLRHDLGAQSDHASTFARGPSRIYPYGKPAHHTANDPSTSHQAVSNITVARVEGGTNISTPSHTKDDRRTVDASISQNKVRDEEQVHSYTRSFRTPNRSASSDQILLHNARTPSRSTSSDKVLLQQSTDKNEEQGILNRLTNRFQQLLPPTARGASDADHRLLTEEGQGRQQHSQGERVGRGVARRKSFDGPLSYLRAAARNRSRTPDQTTPPEESNLRPSRSARRPALRRENGPVPSTRQDVQTLHKSFEKDGDKSISPDTVETEEGSSNSSTGRSPSPNNVVHGAYAAKATIPHNSSFSDTVILADAHFPSEVKDGNIEQLERSKMLEDFLDSDEESEDEDEMAESVDDMMTSSVDETAESTEEMTTASVSDDAPAIDDEKKPKKKSIHKSKLKKKPKKKATIAEFVQGDGRQMTDDSSGDLSGTKSLDLNFLSTLVDKEAKKSKKKKKKDKTDKTEKKTCSLEKFVEGGKKSNIGAGTSSCCGDSSADELSSCAKSLDDYILLQGKPKKKKKKSKRSADLNKRIAVL
jgi:hypothetical protein